MFCSYGLESVSGCGFARRGDEEDDDEDAQDRSEREGQGIRLLETNRPHGSGHERCINAPERRRGVRVYQRVRQHQLSRGSRGHQIKC